MLDYLIKNGFILDGTGRPGRLGSIGIREGRVVMDVDGEMSKTTVDAEGLAISPGFVEPHTHMDAQVFWDPMMDPLIAHGITSVVAGNCGFGLAPLKSEHADYLARLMSRVEGIPLPALQSGVPVGLVFIRGVCGEATRAVGSEHRVLSRALGIATCSNGRASQ